MLPCGCQVIWYNSSDAKGPPPSNSTNPPSGAYMFRPNGVFRSTAPVVMQVVEGPVVTEIRQARRSLNQIWWRTVQHDLVPGAPNERQLGTSTVCPPKQLKSSWAMVKAPLCMKI